MFETDVLVVGGGLAAMRAAVTAAKRGQRVCMAVKGTLCSGASFYPGMEAVACQATDGSREDAENFLREILDAGQGMADEAMYRYYIGHINDLVRRFPEIGVNKTTHTDADIACFAKSPRPIYSWSNWPAIRDNMRRIVEENKNLSLAENSSLAAILQSDGRVAGAVLLRGAEWETVRLKSLVLATGGVGDLYLHNLNTPDLSGDGQALSLRAGAELVNMEFIQFIPGFLSPAYKTVFRQMTIPYIQSLRGADGENLLDKYLPDAAERAECLRLRAKHGPFSAESRDRVFDIAMHDALRAGADFGCRLRYKGAITEDTSEFVAPYLKWLLKEKGVDVARDEIAIAPFYHAENGGVRVGRACETAVRGLFACGEVSGGIHGADRLGGLSTGGCLVFGDLSGESAARFAAGVEYAKLPDANEALRAQYAGRGDLTPEDILFSVRRLLYRAGGVVREEKELSEAIFRIRDWRKNYDPQKYLSRPAQAKDALKADHFLTVAEALLFSMLSRRESRGAHYRSDYPEKNAAFDRRFALRLTESGDLIARPL